MSVAHSRFSRRRKKYLCIVDNDGNIKVKTKKSEKWKRKKWEKSNNNSNSQKLTKNCIQSCFCVHLKHASNWESSSRVNKIRSVAFLYIYYIPSKNAMIWFSSSFHSCYSLALLLQFIVSSMCCAMCMCICVFVSVKDEFSITWWGTPIVTARRFFVFDRPMYSCVLLSFLFVYRWCCCWYCRCYVPFGCTKTPFVYTATATLTLVVFKICAVHVVLFKWWSEI